MSQFTHTYFPTNERGPYYTSTLNAEAQSFSPLSTLSSPTTQRSTLGPSAAVFMAPTVPAVPTKQSVAKSAAAPTTEQNESPALVHTTRSDWEHYPSPTTFVDSSTSHHAPFDLGANGDAPLPGFDIFDPATLALYGIANFSKDADFFNGTTALADPTSAQQDVPPTREPDNTYDTATEHHCMGRDDGFRQDLPIEPFAFTPEQDGIYIPVVQTSHHPHTNYGAAFGQEFTFPPTSSTSEQCGMANPAEQNHMHSNIAYTNDDYYYTSNDKSQYNPLESAQPATDISTEHDFHPQSFLNQNSKQSTAHHPHPIMDSPIVTSSDLHPASLPVTPPEQPAQALIMGEPHVSQNIGDAFDVNADIPSKRSVKDRSRRSGKKTNGLSVAKNAGVRKSNKKGTTAVPSPALRAKAEAISEKADIDQKMRKANFVIATQQKGDTLAKSMGQHLELVRENGRLKLKGVYWKAPEGDDTIPSTEEGKATLVQQLVAAMRNNKGCKEVEGSRQFVNRWGENAKYFCDEELEIAAWSAVDMMVDVHTDGWTSTIMDSNLRDQLQKTMFCTFGDRFGALVKLLTVCFVFPFTLFFHTFFI